MSQRQVTMITMDRDRRLLYAFADVDFIERSLDGESIEQALSRRGVRRLAILLLAGLRHEDRKLTINNIHNLMDKAAEQGLHYMAMWNVVSDALIRSGVLRDPGTAEAPMSAPSDGA